MGDEYPQIVSHEGIRAIAANVFVVDAQLSIGRHITAPTRMSIIRLRERSLIVYSPLPPETVELSSLGEVHHIVAPNAAHHAFARRFADAHPDAMLYSSDALPARFPRSDWGTVVSPDAAEDLIAADVSIKLIRHFAHLREVILWHKPSRTLFCADLCVNFASPERRRSLPWFFRLYLMLPAGHTPLSWTFGLRLLCPREKAKKLLPELTYLMSTWEWKTCVPCHGDIVEEHADALFRRGVYDYVQEKATCVSSSRLLTAISAYTASLAASFVAYLFDAPPTRA